VFSQLIEHLPHKEFQKCVVRYGYGGDCYAKDFSCWDQYLAMAFAQLTYRESLRNIDLCTEMQRKESRTMPRSRVANQYQDRAVCSASA
jgi:hypothetical protein